MSRNILNEGRIFINTITGGEAINISSTNSTSSTCNLKISKQTAKTTPVNTDLFLLEESDGSIKKITYQNLESNIDTNFWDETNDILRPIYTTSSVLVGGTTMTIADFKFQVEGNTFLKGDLELQLDKKIISNNNSADYLKFGDRTFTNNYLSNVFTYGLSFGATADINLATGRAITRGTDSNDRITFNSGNFTFGNAGIFNNSIQVKSTTATNSGHVSFFESSNAGTNNIDLHSPETLTHDYNVYLPQNTDTSLTSVYILSNKNVLGGTNVTISNSTTDTITINSTDTNTTYTGGTNITLAGTTFNLDTTLTGTITFSNTISGSISGNAATATKISSITNSNIVQLTTTQILSNKSFSDMPVCEVGLAVKQSAGTTSGNIRFFDKDNSNYIDLHIEDHAVSSDYNMYLPNDIGETVLVGTRNTQTVINKTLSTGTVYNGNTIAVGYGGTGLASYTSGDILYASATATLSRLAIGSANRFLMSNGSAPVWGLGYSLSSPLIFTGTNISINGLSGNGSNNQIITSTGSGLTYSSTLTSVALSSCTGNISQFTNDSAYLTSSSLATPLTTAVNFGTAATGAVSIGKSNQGLNLIGNSIFLDYTVPFTIGIVSEFIASSLISYDGSITSMVFGEKGGSGYNSAIHSNTVLNLSLTNSAYDITMSSSAGDITYTSPEHAFYGVLKTYGSAILVGEDNSTIHLDVGVNHATGSSNGSSYFTCYFNDVQIGDVRQNTTSSVSYVETSDYRLKTEVEDFNNNLDIINKLKVRKYKFISDINAGINQDLIGFLAHEVNEASEYFDTVVSGKKDETAMWCKKCKSFNCKCGDDCGEMIMKDKYQGIDYGKFTPYLTGAIQELYAIIQEQQKVINNLLNSTSFKDFKSK